MLKINFRNLAKSFLKKILSKKCNFYQNNFKFSAVKEDYKYIYNDIAQKYGNATVKDFRKYEKLEYKTNKLKLDIDFLNSCK